MSISSDRMEYRGHILIIFGLSLVFSPVAIKMWHEKQDDAPTVITTNGAADAACDSSSIQTSIGRLGCGTTQQVSGVRRIDQTMNTMNNSRRMQNSGALFMSAREN